MNYKQQYQKELEKKLTQFLFLCEKNDGVTLLSETEENKVDEYVRLSCLTIVFGFKKVFMSIIAHVEKFFDVFIKKLQPASENFSLIDKWVNSFIENIEHSEARNLLREFWTEQKANLDPNSFNIRQLLN